MAVVAAAIAGLHLFAIANSRATRGISRARFLASLSSATRKAELSEGSGPFIHVSCRVAFSFLAASVLASVSGFLATVRFDDVIVFFVSPVDLRRVAAVAAAAAATAPATRRPLITDVLGQGERSSLAKRLGLTRPRRNFRNTCSAHRDTTEMERTFACAELRHCILDRLPAASLAALLRVSQARRLDALAFLRATTRLHVTSRRDWFAIQPQHTGSLRSISPNHAWNLLRYGPSQTEAMLARERARCLAARGHVPSCINTLTLAAMRDYICRMVRFNAGSIVSFAGDDEGVARDCSGYMMPAAQACTKLSSLALWMNLRTVEHVARLTRMMRASLASLSVLRLSSVGFASTLDGGPSHNLRELVGVLSGAPRLRSLAFRVLLMSPSPSRDADLSQIGSSLQNMPSLEELELSIGKTPDFSPGFVECCQATSVLIAPSGDGVGGGVSERLRAFFWTCEPSDEPEGRPIELNVHVWHFPLLVRLSLQCNSHVSEYVPASIYSFPRIVAPNLTQLGAAASPAQFPRLVTDYPRLNHIPCDAFNHVNRRAASLGTLIDHVVAATSPGTCPWSATVEKCEPYYQTLAVPLEMERLASLFPGLRVVRLHCAENTGTYVGLAHGIRNVLLARLPNLEELTVTVDGLPTGLPTEGSVKTMPSATLLTCPRLKKLELSLADEGTFSLLEAPRLEAFQLGRLWASEGPAIFMPRPAVSPTSFGLPPPRSSFCR